MRRLVWTGLATLLAVLPAQAALAQPTNPPQSTNDGGWPLWAIIAAVVVAVLILCIAVGFIIRSGGGSVRDGRYSGYGGYHGGGYYGSGRDGGYSDGGGGGCGSGGDGGGGGSC